MKNKSETPKVEATIKVKTLVIAIAVVVALIASFVAGWNLRSADQARVQSEAVSLANQLKASK